jgi:hypothetical protein
VTLLPRALFDPIADYFGATQLFGGTYKVFCDSNVAGEFLWFQFGGPDGALIYIPLDEMIVPIPATWKTRRDEDICLFGLAPAEDSDVSNGTVVLGETFLRSAYVVFDLENKKINLANAKWDVTDSHIVELGGDSTFTTLTVTGPSVTQTAAVFTHAPAGAEGLNGTTTNTDKPSSAAKSLSGGVKTTLAAGGASIVIEGDGHGGNIVVNGQTITQTAGSPAATSSSASVGLIIPEQSALPVVLLTLCGAIMLIATLII